MKTYIKTVLVFTFTLSVFLVTTQNNKDWNKIDVCDKYGIDLTRFKSVSKSLKNNPSFIVDEMKTELN